MSMLRRHNKSIFQTVLLLIILVGTKIILVPGASSPVYSASQESTEEAPTPTSIPTSTVPANISVIDTRGNIQSSLALDSAGIAYISYQDAPSAFLKLARCNNNTTCDAPTIITIDSQMQTGAYSSLALDSNDIPVIAYLAASTGDLKLARCNNNTTCDAPTLITVDSAGNSGYFVSLVLDDGDIPVIAYHNSSSLQLKLARCSNNSTCDAPTIRILDSVGQAGRGASLALNADGIPVISYRKNSDLWLVLCNTPTCDSRSHRTIGVMGIGSDFTSVALNSSGIPVIAFYDGNTGALKLAWCNSTACDAPTITTVDNSALTGQYLSLELDSTGIPVISYYHYDHINGSGDLRLAHCNNNTTCNVPTIITLSSLGDVGDYTSLELLDDVPIISYRHITNNDLMLYRGSALPSANADLSVSQVDTPDPVLINNNLTYTMTITNNGPDPTTNVVILGELSANVQFVTVTPAQGSCQRDGTLVTCNLGSLNSGANISITIVVIPTSLGDISNQVSVQADGIDSNPANNSLIVTTTVNPPPTFTPSFTPSYTPTPYTPPPTLTSTALPMPPPVLTATPYTPTDTPIPSDTPTDTPIPPATATNTPPVSPTVTSTPLPSPPPM
jgi:uncharacterized repeat protein (TIGR01451 family)